MYHIDKVASKIEYGFYEVSAGYTCYIRGAGVYFTA